MTRTAASLVVSCRLGGDSGDQRTREDELGDQIGQDQLAGVVQPACGWRKK